MEITIAERLVVLSALALDITTTQEALKRNPSLIDFAENRMTTIEGIIAKITAEPVGPAVRLTRNGTKVQFVRDNDDHADYMRRKVWRIVDEGANNGAVFYTSPEGQHDTNNANYQHDLDVMGMGAL